jgi:hypothetical protein
MDKSPEQDNEREHTNINLIYDYTEYRIKLTNDSINALNTKLSAVLGFSATSIIFSINLPNQAFIPNQEHLYFCYSCLILKTIVCVLLAITIFKCIQGLRPKAFGGMTPPEILMEEYYSDTEDNCRLVITKTWIEALKELEMIRDEKAKIANCAMITLCLAGLTASSSIILACFLSML